MPSPHAAEDRPAHRGRSLTISPDLAPPAIKSDAAPRYSARVPFTYAGTDLARGQVFTLIGARHDEQLVRLRYCVIITPKEQTYLCPDCGGEFLGMPDRDGHARRCPRRRRASGAALTPYEEDASVEAEDKRIFQELALDQTAATLR